MNGGVGGWTNELYDMRHIQFTRDILTALFLAGMGSCTQAFSQTLGKLNVKDFSEEIEVSYQLKSDRPVTVQLYYSEDDGYQWIGPLKSVAGDVGDGISAGRKKIVWNFAEEVNELYGDRFRFKVRSSEHYGFSMKFRDEWFNIPGAITQDLGEDKDLAAYRLRQVDGWNSIELKAPSGNYDFEMHHELKGAGVESNVELVGYRHRPAALGMMFSAVLPGSGIPYVTYGECKHWTVEFNERKSKQGNGNFWGMAIFGGAAVLLHNLGLEAYSEELSRPFGDEESALEARLPYDQAMWGSAGLAGLIYTTQVFKIIKWNKAHKSDMARFVSDWD